MNVTIAMQCANPASLASPTTILNYS